MNPRYDITCEVLSSLIWTRISYTWSSDQSYHMFGKCFGWPIQTCSINATTCTVMKRISVSKSLNFKQIFCPIIQLITTQNGIWRTACQTSNSKVFSVVCNIISISLLKNYAYVNTYRLIFHGKHYCIRMLSCIAHNRKLNNTDESHW
jgi:hypothetical protein